MTHPITQENPEVGVITRHPQTRNRGFIFFHNVHFEDRGWASYCFNVVNKILAKKGFKNQRDYKIIEGPKSMGGDSQICKVVIFKEEPAILAKMMDLIE